MNTPQKLPCNTRLVGPGRIRANGLSLRELSTLLTMLVGRIVIDKSGVSEVYDFELTWAPEQGRVDALRDDVLPPADRDGPSLATALREQLGLSSMVSARRSTCS